MTMPAAPKAEQIFELRYSYEDAPTLRRFSESSKRNRMIVGPFGSGKSSACVMDLYQKSCAQAPDAYGVRRTRWAVVRNTYPQLKDTTIRTFRDWFPEHIFGEYRANPTPDYNLYQQLRDGTRVEAEFLFRALDNPNHVRNLLSLEVTGAWFNEAREIPKSLIDHMDGRINRYPSRKDGGATWAGMIFDTNPCDTDHWIYRLYVEKLPNDPALQEYYELFHQPSGRSAQAENLRWLAPGYYQQIAVGKDADWVKVYVDGQFGYVRDGKPVYTNYLDSKHCAPQALKAFRGVPIVLGWDFGLTPACAFVQLTPKGQLNTIAELCASEMGARRFARDVVKPHVLANYPGIPIISAGDPAGVRREDSDETRSAFAEVREAGFSIRPAKTNAFEARFSAVDHYLTKVVEGKPAFQLSPNCVTLRKGFNGQYKLRRMQLIGQERYVDKPEKNQVSHIHDALQYACLWLESGIQFQTQMFHQQRFTHQAPPQPGAFT